jgi:hypothetical protein
MGLLARLGVSKAAVTVVGWLAFFLAILLAACLSARVRD